MRIGSVALGLVLTSFAVAACSSAEPASSEDTAQAESAQTGGCRTVCPKCRPGQMCPMIACFLDCNGKGHGTCTQMALCIQGYVWDDKKCACVPNTTPPSGCTTDADCRTFSDYCTGCACDALSTSQPDPVCTGPGVRCFADPCGGQTAVCLNGSCSLQSTTF